MTVHGDTHRNVRSESVRTHPPSIRKDPPGAGTRDGSGRVGTCSSLPRSTSFLPTSTYRHYVGQQRLREFDRAPRSVQDEFWQTLRRNLAADRESTAALAETHGVEVRGDHRLLEWDERWRRRARRARVLLTDPESRPFPREEIEAVLEVPAAVYVERLTDEPLPRHRRISCPSPDHDDNDPSCAVYENGWRCFACGASGNAYTFAALLWGLALNGPQFVELHHRLKAVLS